MSARRQRFVYVRSFRERLGVCLAVLLATAFVLAPSRLAFWVLQDLQLTPDSVIGGICAVLWLLLVTLFLGLGGFHYLVECQRWERLALLNALAAKSWVECETEQLRFGFTLLWREWTLLNLPSTAVQSVHWSAGQLSHRIGEDVADWSVWVDMRHPDLYDSLLGPGHVLLQFGQQKSREQVVETGLALVEFLRARGLELAPTGDRCTFENLRKAALSPA